MDIVLIPGLWLDGASWSRVVPVLEEAGHRAHPITLPGLESPGADRSRVSLADHVGAVVGAIDACSADGGGVLLVGHSAGAGVAHAALDARPDRVARAVYVGGFPTPCGEPVAGGFPTDGADIPMPPWEAFDDADLGGLDAEARASLRERAVPSPANLTTDRQRLADSRRYEVPVTVVCTEFSSEILQAWTEQRVSPVRELEKARFVEYVDLPTGHWPQITRPVDLAQAIVERAYRPYVDEQHRIHPPVGAGEVVTVLGFLEYQRATLAWKAGGLDEPGLAVSTAASSLTLGGLLKHMAWVEDHWFSYILHGRARSQPWSTVDWTADRDWEFTSSAADTAAELRGLWRTAVARSRAMISVAIAAGGLDQPAARTGPDGNSPTLRWILLHMIEEYARHNGHADFLRESIDGLKGE